MKRVRFYLPPEITIRDTILGIKRKIPLTRDMTLKMIRRFQNPEFKTSHYKICSETYDREILIDIPLRSQGIVPGDTIHIIPNMICMV